MILNPSLEPVESLTDRVLRSGGIDLNHDGFVHDGKRLEPREMPALESLDEHREFVIAPCGQRGRNHADEIVEEVISSALGSITHPRS